MYRTLVLEDEAEEARRIMDLIQRYGAARNETFQVTWHSSAVELLSDKSRYDLMLLDIELPGINGIEAASLLRVYDEVTPIIFVTNLAKYAVRGYEVGATGFIVKPATFGGLKMALDRALRQIRQHAGRSLMVPTEDGSRVIPLAQLVWIEIKGHHMTYHLEDGESLGSYGSLTQVEKELEGAPVMRVSKGCLINMEKVRRIQTSKLVMVTGDELVVARGRRREIVEALTDYLGGR